jgi:hypothetical protein
MSRYVAMNRNRPVAALTHNISRLKCGVRPSAQQFLSGATAAISTFVYLRLEYAGMR